MRDLYYFELFIFRNNLVDIEWDECGKLTGHYYPPAYEYCPFIDRNLFFYAISDHAIWFDTDSNVIGTPDKVP